MGRWLAALFAAGGTLGLVSMVLPHWHATDTLVETVISASTIPAALSLVWERGRLGPWVVHVALALGTALITVGVYFGHGGAGSIATATLYIWIALFACTFFSWQIAGAHLVLAGCGYGVVLDVNHAEGALALWMFVMGTAVVSGVVVSALVRQVRQLARLDGLTGLLNRRAFEEELARELARAKRAGSPLGVGVVDLDHFKDCNDRLGHACGDAMLIDAARSWTTVLRGTDCLARYGGDEFALVLPNASLDDAAAMVDRLRRVSPPELQFSAGITTWNGAETLDELLARADGACYFAKRGGRNQTAACSAPTPSSAAPLRGTRDRGPTDTAGTVERHARITSTSNS